MNNRKQSSRIILFTAAALAAALIAGCGFIEGDGSDTRDSALQCTDFEEQDHRRVVLCHVPPGNPDNEHTLIVGAPAEDAHLAHGDYLGRCNDDDGPGNSGNARGQGKDKVTICHIPPGNPANAHTITVGAPAERAHLAHGDELGPCGGGDDPGDLNFCPDPGDGDTTDDGDPGTDDPGTSDGDDDTTGDGDDTTTDDGTTDDGTTDDGSTGDGTTDDGSTGDGTTDDGSTDDGSTDDGSTDDGSTDDGSTSCYTGTSCGQHSDCGYNYYCDSGCCVEVQL